MTERNEPVDRRHEEALSAALHAHAGTVRPAGDGLVRIRSRVARRRRLFRFLAPLASVATVAAAVTAVVASGLFAQSTHKPSIQADVSTSSAPVTTTQPAAISTTPAASARPSASTAIAPTAPASTTATTVRTTATTTPATTTVATGPTGVNPPVWPFADAAAAASWQQSSSQKSGEAWRLDPRAVAERFVGALETGLSLPHPGLTGTPPVINADGTASVDVSRMAQNGSTLVLGTVKLSRWTTGADAPWGVVSVTSPAKSQFPLTITAPRPGTAVGSPLAVSYTLTGGAENDDYVGVWSAGAATPASSKHAVTGVGTTVTLTGVPTSGIGFVAVVDGSAASGTFGLSRLAVTPVRYGTSGGAVAAAGTYVAVTDKGIEVREVASNNVVRTLAAGVKNITEAEVSDDGRWVYYLTEAGVSRLRLDGTGGAPEGLAAATGGAQTLSAFGIGGPHAEWLANTMTTRDGSGQSILWSHDASASGQILVGPAMPPVAESVAISPDGSRLSAFVRTGNQGNVMTFDLATATSLSDATSPKACTTTGSECVGVAYAPNGDLLTVTSDGTTFIVFRQHNALVTKLFSVAGTGQGATLDTDATGTKVLLTDAAGHGWRWNGSGQPKSLPGHLIDASW